MSRTLSLIDVCSMMEAKGGCDLNLPPYRVPDTLSPEMRVRILTAIARAAERSKTICGAAKQALSMYLPAGFSLAEADDEAKANSLLRFVQKDIGYKDDPQGEWYQGPIYTLTNGGDCEDLSTLFCAMCGCLGIESRVVWMDQPGAKLNHVTAQVLVSPKRWRSAEITRPSSGSQGSSWKWAETTIESAKVGDHPYDAAKKHKTAARNDVAAYRLGFR